MKPLPRRALRVLLAWGECVFILGKGGGGDKLAQRMHVNFGAEEQLRDMHLTNGTWTMRDPVESSPASSMWVCGIPAGQNLEDRQQMGDGRPLLLDLVGSG